jgi:hypothetical protein
MDVLVGLIKTMGGIKENTDVRNVNPSFTAH